MDASSQIVEIESVSKRYGAIEALRDVALCIPAGVTGLLGPNGSGKSTLIKALLGLLRVQSGQGRVLDYSWPRETRAIRDHIGYLPDDDCYVAGLTGIESVALMARLSGLFGREGLRRSHEMMDYCGFGEERYREVESYSTGMRQKLKFSQALVHDPPLLILDEPTTGLDPDQRVAMLRRIRNLAVEHGKSVILSTHVRPTTRARIEFARPSLHGCGVRQACWFTQCCARGPPCRFMILVTVNGRVNEQLGCFVRGWLHVAASP